MRFYETLEKAFGRSSAKNKTAQIKKDDITSAKKTLSEQINKFQNKLSAFNAKKKVTVVLDESLNLL
jgi:hypothetical protein